jgi:acyl-CoA thioesterase I
LSAASASAETLPSATRIASASGGRIVVLGDSLAVSPSKAESFPAQLQKRLRKSGAQWTVTNAGVSGDRTAGALGRFNAAVPADTRILVLQLGANDGLRGVEIATIEKNLSTMIARAQARNIKVLLCGMLVPPRYGWDYAVAFHGLFPRLASKYHVPLVPFLLDGVALKADMNMRDGIHPNAAGAERIADTVWPYLEPLIRD